MLRFREIRGGAKGKKGRRFTGLRPNPSGRIDERLRSSLRRRPTIRTDNALFAFGHRSDGFESRHEVRVPFSALRRFGGLLETLSADDSEGAIEIDLDLIASAEEKALPVSIQGTKCPLTTEDMEKAMICAYPRARPKEGAEGEEGEDEEEEGESESDEVEAEDYENNNEFETMQQLPMDVVSVSPMIDLSDPLRLAWFWNILSFLRSVAAPELYVIEKKSKRVEESLPKTLKDRIASLRDVGDENSVDDPAIEFYRFRNFDDPCIYGRRIQRVRPKVVGEVIRRVFTFPAFAPCMLFENTESIGNSVFSFLENLDGANTVRLMNSVRLSEKAAPFLNLESLQNLIVKSFRTRNFDKGRRIIQFLDEKWHSMYESLQNERTSALTDGFVARNSQFRERIVGSEVSEDDARAIEAALFKVSNAFDVLLERIPRIFISNEVSLRDTLSNLLTGEMFDVLRRVVVNERIKIFDMEGFPNLMYFLYSRDAMGTKTPWMLKWRCLDSVLDSIPRPSKERVLLRLQADRGFYDKMMKTFVDQDILIGRYVENRVDQVLLEDILRTHTNVRLRNKSEVFTYQKIKTRFERTYELGDFWARYFILSGDSINEQEDIKTCLLQSRFNSKLFSTFLDHCRPPPDAEKFVDFDSMFAADGIAEMIVGLLPEKKKMFSDRTIERANERIRTSR